VEPAAIGESEGEQAPGWSGVSVADAAEVEKVVRRAERLGHAGLANLAAAQMALNDQPRETVRRWIKSAQSMLNVTEATEPESPQSEEEGRVDEPETGAQGYVVPDGGIDVPPKYGQPPTELGADGELAKAREEQEPEPIEGQQTLTDTEDEGEHDGP
jgi:hypothetical protein